ncbi:MAG TPA: GNAT family N-acetyltransferase [Thermoleophilaceae bacterium]|nr:GNAT family N-acetyltransferase [Thermoleophilaceae bacterium]
MHTFFVSPESWRRGVGRGLMSAALAELRSRGYLRCMVWSFAANDGANAFYEVCGFARDGAGRAQEAWAHIPQVRYQRRLT